MNLDQLKLKLTAVFEPAPEGGYTCHFEELPEVFSEGETVEEARSNLLDALTQVMEYHREEAHPAQYVKNSGWPLHEAAGFGAALAQQGQPLKLGLIEDGFPISRREI